MHTGTCSRSHKFNVLRALLEELDNYMFMFIYQLTLIIEKHTLKIWPQILGSYALKLVNTLLLSLCIFTIYEIYHELGYA